MPNVAVHVGINDYPGTDSDLYGCVNDATDLQALLRPFVKTSTLLINSKATKAAIVSAVRTALRALQTLGDTAFVTFSGHGTWIPDRNNDEPDGRDECLVPYDYDKNLLVDDEIQSLLSTRKGGTRVIFITDSCHSGTVFRFLMPPAPGSSRRVRFLPPALLSAELVNPHAPNQAQRMELLQTVAARVRDSRPQPLPGVIHFSGCRDSEYSYDAQFGNRANGAMTYALIKAWHSLKSTRRTYKGLADALLKQLPTADYPQTPQVNALASDLSWPLPG